MIETTYRHGSMCVTRLLSNRGQFFVEQFEERFEGDGRFLLLPCSDKVDANVVRLQAKEGDVVCAQVTSRCGDNGNAFTGFDGREYRVHIVQLVVQTGREAVVITDADDRVEDLRGTGALKDNEALACKIFDADALRGYLAGSGN